MNSHHPMDSDIDRRGHVTDETIHQAMQQLHTPKWFPKETPGEFESRMAASTRMRTEYRDEERTEWRRLYRIRELDEESNQLAQEQAKYESTKSSHERYSEQVRESPHNNSKDSLWRDHTRPDGTPHPTPRGNHPQDNPGDPDNGISSDKTYLLSSTWYSNTESDVTDSESCERSSRTLHHRRSDDKH